MSDSTNTSSVQPAAGCQTDQELVARAQSLIVPGERRILGIVGAPGAGKSRLASVICRSLGASAALVPMDGFHLASSELRRLGRAERKGAIDTFDAAGYVNFIKRLRSEQSPVVYAPEFRRDVEEPIACAIPIAHETPLVITEGNYLLVDQAPWSELRDLLDEAWFLDIDEQIRLERLIARHAVYGKTPEAAREWSLGSDQRNAELVSGTRARADLFVRWADTADFSG